MNNQNIQDQTKTSSKLPISLSDSDIDNNTGKSSFSPTTSSTGKEHEMPRVESKDMIREASAEIELPKEVEQAGIKVHEETIEIPPDVKKLGVKPSGSSTPVSFDDNALKVKLPISDQNVVSGLHEGIFSSLHWLAVWCIKKLQKFHVVLKVVHGKVVRIKN